MSRRPPVILTWLLCLLWLLPSTARTQEETYVVEAGRSVLHWRIYRSGPLAERGHNHVIAARGLSGEVSLVHGGPTRFTLTIPVTRLEVDNPALRRRYGPDFNTGISEQDRTGTRINMLGPALLNSARFPQIRLDGTTTIAPDKGTQQVSIPVNIDIAGRRVRVQVPATVQHNGRSLRARGTFSLTHRQLGLKPFSAVMGALRVAERIDFTFDIRATAPR
ncbi:YceI family protein [Microbulbifer sediminum]|uniref:YceI family protein n=1 Tax=Microbulbifer sediminum TaxID=2904250 RepID=UPI001F3D4C05|nr:YceI family protein [Microbulbifer sediminum]